MNEVLKRRLAGALVLFGLTFALASLLPEARAPARTDGSQTVTYDLGSGQPMVEPQAPRPLQLQESLALGASETGPSSPAWYVQVGSFENQANAHAVQVALSGLKLPTVVQAVRAGKSPMFRVRVGPYPAESAARAALVVIRRHDYRGARLVHPGSD